MNVSSYLCLSLTPAWMTTQGLRTTDEPIQAQPAALTLLCSIMVCGLEIVSYYCLILHLIASFQIFLDYFHIGVLKKIDS